MLVEISYLHLNRWTKPYFVRFSDSKEKYDLPGWYHSKKEINSISATLLSPHYSENDVREHPSPYNKSVNEDKAKY